jgi:hypothetical protein
VAPVAQTGAGNVTTATVGASTSGGVTIAKPANVADGDLLVAVVNHANSGGSYSTVPSGWTAGTTHNTNRTSGVWYKAVPSAAAETATDYTWATSDTGSGRMGGLIVRITGADLDDPWDAAGSWSPSLTAPAVTAVDGDALLLGAFWSYIAGTTPNAVSAPSGMSSVGGWSVSPSSSTTHLLASEDLAAAGSTGSRTATATPSGSSALGVLFTIKPGTEEHSGSATIGGALSMAASGTPAVDGSGTLSGALDMAASGTPAIDGAGGLGGLLTMTATGRALPSIALPPRPRTRWQLVAGPASGGHDLALTEARSRRYTAKLRDASDLSFSIDGRHPQAEAIAELSTDVHLLFTGDSGTVELDRCRVGQTRDEIDEDTHRLDVTCLDYRAVLGRRILYSGDTLTFAGEDQADIAWSLIAATQAQAAGSLGIYKGFISDYTGVDRDRTYEAGDSIGQRIQELSEVIDGFDWDITPDGASSLRFDVWYPQRGSDRGVVLILGGLAAAVTREVDPSDFANAIRYTGAQGDEETPGPDPVELEAPYLPDATSAPEGRWDVALGDDGLTTQGALDERAAWQLAQSQVVTPVYTVRLRRGGWEGPSHIWVGDTVRLIIPSGRLAVDTTARVHEVQIDIDEDGGETVTLSLGGARPDFRRWPSQIERRLKDLERR